MSFTKKYLTELIDKRLEELKEPSGGWTDDEKLLVRMRRENAVLNAKAILNRHVSFERIEDILSNFDLADVMDEGARETIDELSQLVTRVTTNPHAERHDYRQLNEVEERIRKQRTKTPHNPPAEIARLERVRGYLTESPADEFSLTLMKQLGFIDIIKNAING